MNPQERERLVDSVLDRALGPQLIEPRPGLEERILTNLHTQPQQRPRWRWMWIPTLAAAAVLAVVIGMRVTHRESPAPQVVKKSVELPKSEVATKPQSRVQPVTPRLEIGKRVARRPNAVAKNESLPRMDVFPAPVPLTDQERLLLAFVNQQRPQAQLVASEQQSERERAQKYFETGEAPVAPPTPAQPMR